MAKAPARLFIHHSDQITIDGTPCLAFTSSAPVNLRDSETEYVREDLVIKPLMDSEKFKKLSESLFASAAAHAERDEVDFVGGDPDQWFQIHGQYAAFEAAVEYFDNCDFKYSN